jgi:hypothetical protein
MSVIRIDIENSTEEGSGSLFHPLFEPSPCSPFWCTSFLGSLQGISTGFPGTRKSGWLVAKMLEPSVGSYLQ